MSRLLSDALDETGAPDLVLFKIRRPVLTDLKGARGCIQLHAR